MVQVRLEEQFLLVTPEGVRRVPLPIAGRLRDAELEGGAEADTEGRLFQAILARGETDHAVFLKGSATHASEEDAELALARLRDELGHGQLALVEDEGTGWALVTIDESDRPEDTAAAVAAVKWSWGWDGSNPMDIVVGDLRFRVELRAAAGGVNAEVTGHEAPVHDYGVSKEVKRGIKDRARRARSSFPDAPSELRGELRELARSCQVLPLKADQEGLYALRHDGEVVHYDWNEASHAKAEKLPPVPTIESDSHRRDAMLMEAVEHYPFLEPLLSSRPSDGEPGPEPGETGTRPEGVGNDDSP